MCQRERAVGKIVIHIRQLAVVCLRLTVSLYFAESKLYQCVWSASRRLRRRSHFAEKQTGCDRSLLSGSGRSSGLRGEPEVGDRSRKYAFFPCRYGGTYKKKILESVKLISYAESLGGVESLITYPMLQTHGDVPVEIREHLGITEDFLECPLELKMLKI